MLQSGVPELVDTAAQIVLPLTYKECTTQKQQIAFLKAKLSTDARWAQRAVVRIYHEQDEDEKQNASTTKQNSRGFTAFDAEILTEIAQERIAGKVLDFRQYAVLYKRMPKYANQLRRIIAATP